MALVKGVVLPKVKVSLFRLPDVIPYLKPVRLIVPVSPEKEPCRVAPVELLSETELAVITVAVGSSPPTPPPDWFHS